MENLFRDWDLLVVYSFLEIFRSFLAATVLRESLHLASAAAFVSGPDVWSWLRRLRLSGQWQVTVVVWSLCEMKTLLLVR